jgi:hypothetical protein
MTHTTLTTELLKALALMQFNGDEFTINGSNAFDTYGNEIAEYDGDDDKYMVLTDEEADQKAADYIKDSLWAFNADFIIDHSKLPYEALEMVQSFQQEKCEGANETIEALIEDMDGFIEDAIGADGRGHFLSSYDGHENEETVEGITFYIYRLN